MNRTADSNSHVRTLIYIPIVHTEADMGTLDESVRRATMRKAGRTALKRKARTIDKIWDEIERIIGELDLSYQKVRLYQDGLPVCGREADIVNDLAKQGSRNHRLLVRLMQRGATIMGTESADLLVQEYERYKRFFVAEKAGRRRKMSRSQEAEGDLLVEKRDQYAARRINTTLRRGETGILFMGMLHALGEFLNEDIRLVYPIGDPTQVRRKL
ncbi:MAG: hypothetical protein JW883_02270 [Deltaproteobacteria bacterium]|nr:hypothetical protein [Deltaproteobacteria bacterium]